MKVMLIMPPIWDACNPYLSLPTLSGVLKSAGYEVILRDLNIEFQDAIFSQEFFLKCRDSIKRYISKYEFQDSLMADNINDYAVAIENLVRVEYALANIEDAKSIFRDKSVFYLPAEYY